MQKLEIVTPAVRRRKKDVAQDFIQAAHKRGDVNRWAVYKQLCVAKTEFHLNDRCLAVLSSLLSFLPRDQLSAHDNPVVFPSNRQLSLRAHGMPKSSIRRHLTSLINAGIIVRNDSPNGKRYAHKDGSGAIQLAFGFSFLPMIERAREIAQKAEQIQVQHRALKLLRDQVSITRREIAAKFVDCEKTPEIENIFARFRTIVDAIPRRATSLELTSVKANLDSIQAELANLLINKIHVEKRSGKVAHFERQHNESLTESLYISKNENLNGGRKILLHANSYSSDTNPLPKPAALSLNIVLRSCPDIRAYCKKGIVCWRDLLDAAKVVSTFLGITQSVYQEAAIVLGRQGVSAVVAWLLQRSAEIHSPGGYLRTLTQKARIDAFALKALFVPSSRANAHQNG